MKFRNLNPVQLVVLQQHRFWLIIVYYERQLADVLGFGYAWKKNMMSKVKFGVFIYSLSCFTFCELHQIMIWKIFDFGEGYWGIYIYNIYIYIYIYIWFGLVFLFTGISTFMGVIYCQIHPCRRMVVILFNP